MSAPNTSLYIHNLNDKVNKQELSIQLYSLFSTYGSVIDLVAQKGNRMKGQAWCVFRDLASATSAMRSCEGMIFYGKPLRIEYAKTKSYATLKREDPEFVPPSALKAQSHPPIGLINQRQARMNGTDGKRAREGEGEDSGRATKRVNGGEAGEENSDEEMEIEEDENANAASSSAQAPPQTQSAPSHTLLCTNLPQEVSDDVLAVLFQQYQGFQSTAVAPSAPPTTPASKIARVLFDSPDLARVARDALDGFTLKKGWSMGVAYV